MGIKFLKRRYFRSFSGRRTIVILTEEIRSILEGLPAERNLIIHSSEGGLGVHWGVVLNVGLHREKRTVSLRDVAGRMKADIVVLVPVTAEALIKAAVLTGRAPLDADILERGSEAPQDEVLETIVRWVETDRVSLETGVGMAALLLKGERGEKIPCPVMGDGSEGSCVNRGCCLPDRLLCFFTMARAA
ncbi:MAG TPA: hypothetical protein VJB99_03410 [Patescibacteria group bacterium]|nr:hypothetical protein [Patescibacteria group bacterium]